MGVYKLSAAGSVLTNRTEYKSMNAGNMYGAMVPIASVTVSGSTIDTITFDNIPQTYQDLFIVASIGANTSYIGAYLKFNNDTSTLYSNTSLVGQGSSAASYRQTGQGACVYGGNDAGIVAATSNYSATEMHILNYSNTSTFKTLLSRYAQDRNGSGETDLCVNLYRSTSAITRIDLFSGRTPTAYISAGSTATLYGIRAVSS
jgi:hypothetical protein